jgi:hypothetical protein
MGLRILTHQRPTMANVNPRANQLQTIPPKDADKDEKDTKKTIAPLEEDDEFEDFPVEGSQSPVLR